MSESPCKSLDSAVSETLQRPSKVPRTQEDWSDEEEGEVAKSMRLNPSRVQRYLVAVEYIGTRFFGSQKQLNVRTVVGVLEDAFQKFIGQPVQISLSSRTDAGVHALSNVCHVDVERISKRKPGEVLPPHDPEVVKRAVNHFLQKNEGDIMVVDVRCVPTDFHARFKAQERMYFYRLSSGPEPLSTFEKDRSWHVQEKLDLVSMQEACKILVGHHDFSSFRASGCQAKSPIRTLDELSVSEVVPSLYFPSLTEREQSSLKEDSCCINLKNDDDLPVNTISRSDMPGTFNGGNHLGFGMRSTHRCYVVTARACSFLYHQVRLLVGVLKSVGVGDITMADVRRILDAKSVTASPPMAPACGLYLGHVKYDLP
ncbi:hypothetical protein K2173_020856 [Erythroxylum novogranatense]|uniref:tRNA pseudouridine synthase n=1 Tax=Erythroxylum novogranatense TaxID=1862640 RepID=A0AAV8TM04_9ROSI|nr:hypothetical protein K2173_020856 [Erythroxylum novogranatense]